jgi:hypothetical protein
MDNRPLFTFPLATDSKAFNSTFMAKQGQPQIQLDTDTETREGYELTSPQRRHSRPANLLLSSTPPESPTRSRSYTMGSQDPLMRKDSGIFTPPSTPTIPSHAKRNSASSDIATSLASLRHGDSTSSRNSRTSLASSAQPGSTEPIIFPHQSADYEFLTDSEGRKTPIGVGAWSDVYLATPRQPTASTPPLYAIKVPGSTSAKKVLTAESRILSYLSRFPGAESHIVSFYGQDPRNSALVLGALSGTLEDWITTHLNSLDESARARKLAEIFPTVALSLFDSLSWMQDKSCHHADIKPSNILLCAPSSTDDSLHPVFSDFSSSILTHVSSDETAIPAGGATWDFLDPACISSTPAAPSCTTDLWSLAITLLFLVLGQSPYETCRGNRWQHLEMVKSGMPLQCADGARLKGLSRDLGFDVGGWLGMVLVKDGGKRVGIEVWREELMGGMKVAAARM